MSSRLTRATSLVPVGVRHVVGLGIASVLAFGLRWTGRRAGVALVYHTIDDREGDPARELVPPIERSRFRRQMRHLRRRYRLVPANELTGAVAARRRGQRFPVSVTFDDDRPQQVRYAAPILHELGVRATFFVSGSSLEGPRSYWWERVQRVVDRGIALTDIRDLLPAAAATALERSPLDVHAVGAVIEELTPGERDEVSTKILRLAGPDPPDAGLRAAGVVALTEADCTIGFHTRNHDKLVLLDDGQLERALRDGCDDLERLVGYRIDAIAYPHGAADRRVADAARRTGYSCGFTTSPNVVTPASDPLLLGRLPTERLSSRYLALSIVRALLLAPSGRAEGAAPRSAPGRI
jgi:peptidoglycan/xylan/chitin deacetylase (PgdA/CDA1 family)